MNKKGWHNGGMQYCSGPDVNNAKVRDVKLAITAHKEQRRDAADWGCQGCTSP